MNTRSVIFQSVFPASKPGETPTPTATPQIGAGSFGQSNGNYDFEDHNDDDDATKQIRWERAWHTSTSSLTLPSTAVDPPDNTHGLYAWWRERMLAGTSEAVSYLTQQDSLIQSPTARKERPNLYEWYQNEVIRHFTEFQLPAILTLMSPVSAESDSAQGKWGDHVLAKLIPLLSRLRELYGHPVGELMWPYLGPLAEKYLEGFTDRFLAVFAKTLETPCFMQCLAEFIRPRVTYVLDHADGENRAAVAEEVCRVLTKLVEVGLVGAQAQQLLAEIFDEQVTLHIRREYSWPHVSSTAFDGRLPTWVREFLVPFVYEVSRTLPYGSEKTPKIEEELKDWKKRGIHELAERRLAEAFGIVLSWEDELTADLSEISTFLHTASGRAHVANKLIKTINHHLLMPGAATIEILRVYVNMFLAFDEVDRSGLLLARIMRPIRRYLRERDDTVRIIIQSLLTDYENTTIEDEALIAFSRLVQESHDPAPVDDGSGPLYDFNWVPDPIDATPEWKVDERPEIFKKLIDIFDNKDIFVKEFQTTLSESLLRGAPNHDQEIRVLELFKSQIGEAQLQACEVMLKDISDSHRTDEVIKKEQAMHNAEPQVTAKILSRFYWPSLDREHMLVPKPVEDMQLKYSTSFEIYKPSRKLTWLQNLGQAKVELHLKDRVVEETVQTWQASVIYTFSGESGAPIRKTAAQVIEELQMDDELVEAALAFWVSKQVLKKDGDHYIVLEEASATTGADKAQSSASATASNAAASGSAADSGVGFVRKRDEAVAQEKMAIFWQYTVNMLTNQGPMPLQRIVMMLKLVVPGGVPYSNDDLKAYLSKQVEDGKLEVVGGNYKIIK